MLIEDQKIGQFDINIYGEIIRFKICFTYAKYDS